MKPSWFALLTASLVMGNGSNVWAESFYGIEIGAPMAIRNCTSDDFGKFPAAGELCIDGNATEHPWGARTIHLRYTGSQLAPWGYPPYSFYVVEYENQVVRINLGTYGEGWQEEALRDLSAKFGKPNKYAAKPMRAGFGRPVFNYWAIWKKPGYDVEFNGIRGSTDLGTIEVRATGSAAEATAANSWRASKSPKM